MTQLEELEQRIYDDGILIIKGNGLPFSALAINAERKAILLNLSAFQTDSQKYVALTHEYFHLKDNTMYHINTDYACVREREKENHRKMVRELVPMSVLFPLLEMGLYDFEIADKQCE